MQQLKSRTPAGLTAYLVIASTVVLGTAVGAPSAQAHAAPARITGSAAAKAAEAKAAGSTKAAGVKAAKAAAPAKTAAGRAPAQKSYPNNLEGWISEARAVLAAHGDHVPNAHAIKARAMTESSGNPRAENHWDGNQALYGGTYGLIQTIKPTFAEWSLPGHKDILDPVDSIIAGVRYANDRYGSFDSVAYGKQGY
ncbi:transglycosylase SLT domain-containing protein [Streptacidiphilus sp. PAMC 29251]